MFWKPFEMVDALEREPEAKLEQILKLEEKGRKITLKDEQRNAVKQLCFHAGWLLVCSLNHIRLKHGWV